MAVFQKNRNGNSVFGLRRRVRIACPTFQKTILFHDIASLFLGAFPRSRSFYTFLRFRLSCSGVFPNERFLCTCWAPRPPKPQKWAQKGCHLSPVLGPFFQTWSHLGPQVPKMTPRDPKTQPPSLPREPKREKSAQNGPKKKPT